MVVFPTPKLDSLWPELLKVAESLHQGGGDTLAAPFCSAADAGYGEFRLRFMLVGRATRGSYDLEGFRSQLSESPSKALMGRKELNRRLVHEYGKSSPFWRALVAGSRCCGAAAGYENSVWSNLAKLGYSNRDVDARLFHQQEEIAEHTLRAELADYQPTAVHFAVGTLGGECILRATGTKNADWERLSIDGPKSDIWFLNSGRQKMIWTRHPNWAAKELVQTWNAKLRELVEELA